MAQHGRVKREDDLAGVASVGRSVHRTTFTLRALNHGALADRLTELENRT